MVGEWTLKHIHNILEKAPRIGADKDEPEGVRYIQISDTLANELAKLIKDTVMEMESDRIDAMGEDA